MGKIVKNSSQNSKSQKSVNEDLYTYLLEKGPPFDPKKNPLPKSPDIKNTKPSSVPMPEHQDGWRFVPRP